MPVGVLPMLAATVYSSIQQNRATGKAAKSQAATVSEQINFAREQDTLNRAEDQRYNDEMRRQWDAEQQQAAEDRLEERKRYGEETAESKLRDRRNYEEDRGRYLARETRLQPYRRAGTAAVGQLSQLASQAGVQLMPVGQGQMTAGLAGAPGAPSPYPRPTPPPTPVAPPPQTMGALVPPPR